MRRIGTIVLLLLAFVLILDLAGFIGNTAPKVAPAAIAAPVAVDAPAAIAAPLAVDTPDAIDAPEGLVQSTGKLSFLRVHDVGSGFGPPSDFLDVEVVAQLNSDPSRSFGFQLRDDSQRAARQGMLDLLRDAFNNNWTVSLDYNIDAGKNNGTIIRVALIKP